MGKKSKPSPQQQSTSSNEQKPLPAAVLADPEQTDESPDPKWKAAADTFSFLWKFAGGVAALVVGVYAFIHWVDEKVDKKIEKLLGDPVVLRKIAAESRPALVFDSKGSITSDMGAAQFIKDQKIRFEQDTNTTWIAKVSIDFIIHQSNPPFLSSLSEIASVKATRGPGLSWEFEVFEQIALSDATNRLRQFRLELAP